MLKISMTTEPIEFYNVGTLHIVFRVVLGYLRHGMVLDIFYSLNTVPLDARCAATSPII